MGRIILFVGLGLALLIGIIVALTAFLGLGLEQWMQISIIILAVFSCLSTLIGIGVLGTLLFIALTLRENVVPLIENATDAARTVKGTAVFVGEGMATPIIKVAGAAAGVRALVQTLVRRGQKPSTNDPTR